MLVYDVVFGALFAQFRALQPNLQLLQADAASLSPQQLPAAQYVVR